MSWIHCGWSSILSLGTRAVSANTVRYFHIHKCKHSSSFGDKKSWFSEKLKAQSICLLHHSLVYGPVSFLVIDSFRSFR